MLGDMNREYCKVLKAKVEKEGKTLICLDCKTSEYAHELIVLCPAHAKMQKTLELIADPNPSTFMNFMEWIAWTKTMAKNALRKS
jgi:hypothetical protein